MSAPRISGALTGGDLFAAAARAVARGGDLDAILDTLVELARSSSRGHTASILLLHETGRWLMPLASVPPESPGAASLLGVTAVVSIDAEFGEARGPDDIELPPGSIEADASPALLAAMADRRPSVVSVPSAGLEAAGPIAIVPLVTASADGSHVVDGALVAGLPAGAVDPVPDELLAIADLAAVAIRQTRLENALVERADWLDRLANTDALTGLANRRTFDRMLELELARADRQGTVVGLMLITVDGLAGVRDTSGDAVADELLRQVAATLGQELRLIDTVARVDIDTFGAICPGAAGPEVAVRVRDAVGRLAVAAGSGTAATPVATVSIGIARSPHDGRDAAALTASAESALRDARSRGPGSVVLPEAKAT